MLFERSHANQFFELVDGLNGELPEVGDLNIPRSNVCVATYDAAVKVVKNGNRSGRVDPKGPAPLDMPAWGEVLEDNEIIAVLSYIVSLGEFDDDEDDEEDEEDEEDE